LSKLIEIIWRSIHPHPDWSEEIDPVVWIEPSKLDVVWRVSPGWVGPGGVPGGQDDRYARAGIWFCGGRPTNMIQIWMSRDSVEFTDGRHRFAWLRDHGVAAIPVQTSPECLELGIEGFRTDMRRSLLTLPLV
jgi:hypothetical protein